MSSTKKNILITGAASGLGLELSKKLALDHNVYAIDLKWPLQAKQSFQGTKIEMDLNSMDGLYEKLPSHIDQVLLCAGIGHYGSFQEMPFESIESILGFNFLKQYELCRLLEDKFNKKSVIMFIGSLSGLIPGRDHEVYAASKRALHSLVFNWSSEAQTSYQIKIFHPGAMNTKFHERVGFDKKEAVFEPPQDVAKKVILALDSKESIHYSKKAEHLFAFLYRRLFPLLDFVMRKRTNS